MLLTNQIAASVTKAFPPDDLEFSLAHDVTSVGNIPNLIPRQINKQLPAKLPVIVRSPERKGASGQKRV